MKRDFWKSVKLLVAQLLDLNIDEQLLLENAKYLIHDRDTKYTAKFYVIMKWAGIEP